MVEEHFTQETFSQDGVEVAQLKPNGNASETFREDVATIIVPIQKFSEFCDTMCKMRDAIPKALAAREAAMAKHTGT